MMPNRGLSNRRAPLARRALALLVLGAVSATPGVALASGLELLPVGGARSVGRGGAVAARPEDPMTMLENPAGLAYLPDNSVIFNPDLPLHDMCVDPYGYYGWGVYNRGSSEFGDPLALDPKNPKGVGTSYATTPLGKVCNSARSTAIPQMAWAGRITDKLSLGAGFVAPVVVPGLQFGGDDGTVQTPYGPRPTPTRYSLIKQDVTYALAPTVAAAYRIARQLSAGLTLQVLMLRAEASQVQNAVSGTQPSTDWLAKLTTQDFFVPALVFSVHSRPIEALNLMASFRWSDGVHGSGDVVYETNTFQRGNRSGSVPYTNEPIQLADVTVRMPWQLTAGARYAGLLKGNIGEGDPMATELWDVEVDVGYALNERASGNSVSPGEDATIVTREASGAAGTTTAKLKDVTAFEIDRHSKNSATVRLAGSYSVVPRRIQVHAGGFYESRGVDPAYADIDSFAFQRLGFGLGVVLRFGKLDLQAAYGHIFSETLDVAPPPHQNVENAKVTDPRSGFDQRVGGTFGQDGTRTGGQVLPDPTAPDPAHADAVAAKTQRSAVTTSAQPERVINAGKYTAAFDILSVGVVYHF